MFAILGTLEFTVTGGISGMQHSGSADWAEHARITAKPLLEWIGEGLDECHLTIELHPLLGNPEQRLRALRLAKSEHQPLAFVMGSGEYLGPYVITQLSNTVRRATATGLVMAATVQVSLREYMGAFVRKVEHPGLLDPTVSGKATAGASPGLVSRQSTSPSMVQQVLSHAKTAGNVLRAGQNVYQAVKTGNPAIILGQVPQLLGVTAGALGPLQGLVNVAGLMRDGADLFRVGEDVLGSVMGARDSLNPVDLGNIIERISASHGSLEQAMTVLDSANTRLAELAADVLTRRV
ncbi:phage tail protein [Pseudomonas prosekii]|uniref:phage tail protein n=1 Tax=Pseudomonas prosekii TaxID=1148509 RepID=UPI00387B6ADC